MTANFPLLDFELSLRGERVFVTGHTGFTGGWLVSWLKRIGCDVAGPCAITCDRAKPVFCGQHRRRYRIDYRRYPRFRRRSDRG